MEHKGKSGTKQASSTRKQNKLVYALTLGVFIPTAVVVGIVAFYGVPGVFLIADYGYRIASVFESNPSPRKWVLALRCTKARTEPARTRTSNRIGDLRYECCFGRFDFEYRLVK